MAGFRTSDERLHLLDSDNGTAFATLSGGAVYNAPTGDSVRDPSIIEHDGYYWCAHTKAGFNNATQWTLLRSTDLHSWTKITDVSVTGTVATANRVWAPELFVDGATIRCAVSIGSGGTTGTFRIYEQHATNSGLTTWSNPVEITGTSFPTSMIDGFWVKDGTDYVLWYKDEVTKHIEQARSSSVTSGYTIEKEGNWNGWGADLEGPCVVSEGGSNLRLFCDKYAGSNQGLYTATSSNNGSTWSALSAVASTWTDLRHGTVIR
jgi:sucrose-6-phosphate hydrolase SacC (GH32 family)